eukprot:TRINITY_DN648_c0_g3_i2.p1 TRINITY_DN648_c0_g3~~TRINITY_DN648_c0_g3_i2.p1  ORF type:complete len:176 (-),score=28.38 TRINITY_DN648_c0_g3_i2:202-729(-)
MVLTVKSPPYNTTFTESASKGAGTVFQLPSMDRDTSPSSSNSTPEVNNILLNAHTSLSFPVVDDSPPPVHEMLDFSRKLNLLKKNYIAYRTSIMNTTVQISHFFPVRQQAALLLKVYDSGPMRFSKENMDVVIKIWKSVTSQDSSALQSFSALVGASGLQPASSVNALSMIGQFK